MGQMMSNLQNPNVVNPGQAKWGDLDNTEKAARALGGFTTGLNSGFQNYLGQDARLRQQGGGGQFSPVSSVQVPQFSAQNMPGGGAGTGDRTKNPYFWGYGV